jgi:hypothetical protein
MNNYTTQKMQLLAATARYSNYFYYIAGMSVLNTVLALFTSITIGSALALGMTEFVDGVGLYLHNIIIGIAFTVFMAGVFSAIAHFAGKGNIVVYLIGMVLYGLDAILLVVFKDWIGIAVHCWLLYTLFQGIHYAINLKEATRLEAEEARRQRYAQVNQAGQTSQPGPGSLH